MENSQPVPGQASTQPPMQAPTVPQEPNTEPVTATPVTEEPKKKKTGLVVSLIIIVLVIIGGLIAAYFLIWKQPSPEEAVGGAVKKLISANAPQKVVAEGATTFTSAKQSENSDPVVVYSKNQYDFSRGAETSNIRIQFKSEKQTVNVNLEMMAFADGTIYLRANELKQALQDLNVYSAVKTTDMALKAAGSDFSISNSIDSIEGQWLEIDLGAALGYLKEYFNLNIAQDIEIESNILTEAIGCMVTESDKFLSNSSQISNLYSQNSFLIAESGIGSDIEKKQNPLYKVTIDAAKLSNFVNAGISANLYNGFYNCFGIKTDTEPIQMTTAETFKGVADYYKNGLFLEIDDQYNITRTYLDSNSGDYQVINDYNITYPESIIIAKPTEYVSLENLIKQIETAVKSISQ